MRQSLSPPEYVIEGRLGSGASADVYRVRLLASWCGLPEGSSLALKLYRSWLFEGPDADRHLSRLHRETSHAIADQRNCVRIYGSILAAHDGQQRHAILMELVDGVTLSRFIEDHSPLSNGLIRDLGIQLTEAVAGLHEAGIHHRDIKPDNIMIASRATRPLLKLMDFGVIVDLHDNIVTETHEFLGTVRYAAPEWILGRCDHSQQALAAIDLYGIGATLAEMINGYPPFPKVRSRFQLATLKASVEPPIVRSDVAPRLVSLAAGLLAADPQRRTPRSAREVQVTIQSTEIDFVPAASEKGVIEALAKFSFLHERRQERDEVARRHEEQRQRFSTAVSNAVAKARAFAAMFVETKASPNAAFVLCESNEKGISFPLAISVRLSFDTQSSRGTIWLAGFYADKWQMLDDESSYRWGDSHRNWRNLLGHVDDEDRIYIGPTSEELVASALLSAMGELLQRYLEMNRAQYRAALFGLRHVYFFYFSKLRVNGEILKQPYYFNDLQTCTRCLVADCSGAIGTAKFLCDDHKKEYLAD